MSPPDVPFVTRFAPSPTGRLHLGHAYSALVAFDRATREGGRFILRIEDIDTTRCRPEYEAGIGEDLQWLGLSWEHPPRRQSDHFADYAAALAQLTERGLTYPCFCTRKDIAAEVARAPSAPHGPEGALYPGTCRAVTTAESADRIAAGTPYAIRLDVDRALAALGNTSLHFTDERQGTVTATPGLFGDIVLTRKDTPASYHLAVTHDDALEGITHVIRGEDLYESTHVHVLLQALLGLPTPVYHHHSLITDDAGRRYAKRDRAETLEALRAGGVTPDEIRTRLGL